MMVNKEGFTHESKLECRIKEEKWDMLQNCPVSHDELFENLGLFLNSKDLARILFMNKMYEQIVDVPGVVMEFGVKWGGNLSLFSALRGVYEPYNVRRKIIGFDTFEGFPAINKKDGNAPLMKEGNLALPSEYVNYLNNIMNIQEQTQPLEHIKKFEIMKGDACIEIDYYLESHPETIIALAYFDFDIYEPTKVCLEKIKNRLVKGSVIGFDELNDSSCPGETLAVMETIGLNNVRLKRTPWCTKPCWYVVE